MYVQTNTYMSIGNNTFQQKSEFTYFKYEHKQFSGGN